ncbi:hypothetical protein BGZ83_011963 [Gryganskiella cystojenkinii]|nr:hypothetical protein BGZ83_011963 [Gryganskiella cystojenkinii]
MTPPNNEDRDHHDRGRDPTRPGWGKQKKKKKSAKEEQSQHLQPPDEQQTLLTSSSSSNKFFEDAVDPSIWSNKTRLEQVKDEMNDHLAQIKFGTGVYNGVLFPMMKVVPGSSSDREDTMTIRASFPRTDNRPKEGGAAGAMAFASTNVAIKQQQPTNPSNPSNTNKEAAAATPGTLLHSGPPPPSQSSSFSSITLPAMSAIRKKKKRKVARSRPALVSVDSEITDLKRIMDGEDTEQATNYTPKSEDVVTTVPEELNTNVETEDDTGPDGEVYQRFDSRGDIIKIQTIQVPEDNDGHHRRINYNLGHNFTAHSSQQQQEQNQGLVLGPRSVLWADIEACFPNLVRIQIGDQYVPMMRNDRLYRRKPHRIQYHPGVTLRVIYDNPAIMSLSSSLPYVSSSSTSFSSALSLLQDRRDSLVQGSDNGLSSTSEEVMMTATEIQCTVTQTPAAEKVLQEVAANVADPNDTDTVAIATTAASTTDTEPDFYTSVTLRNGTTVTSTATDQDEESEEMMVKIRAAIEVDPRTVRELAGSRTQLEPCITSIMAGTAATTAADVVQVNPRPPATAVAASDISALAASTPFTFTVPIVSPFRQSPDQDSKPSVVLTTSSLEMSVAKEPPKKPLVFNPKTWLKKYVSSPSSASAAVNAVIQSTMSSSSLSSSALASSTDNVLGSSFGSGGRSFSMEAMRDESDVDEEDDYRSGDMNEDNDDDNGGAVFHRTIEHMKLQQIVTDAEAQEETTPLAVSPLPASTVPTEAAVAYSKTMMTTTKAADMTNSRLISKVPTPFELGAPPSASLSKFFSATSKLATTSNEASFGKKDSLAPRPIRISRSSNPATAEERERLQRELENKRMVHKIAQQALDAQETLEQLLAQEEQQDATEYHKRDASAAAAATFSPTVTTTTTAATVDEKRSEKLKDPGNKYLERVATTTTTETKTNVKSPVYGSKIRSTSSFSASSSTGIYSTAPIMDVEPKEDFYKGCPGAEGRSGSTSSFLAASATGKKRPNESLTTTTRKDSTGSLSLSCPTATAIAHAPFDQASAVSFEKPSTLISASTAIATTLEESLRTSSHTSTAAAVSFDNVSHSHGLTMALKVYESLALTEQGQMMQQTWLPRNMGFESQVASLAVHSHPREDLGGTAAGGVLVLDPKMAVKIEGKAKKSKHGKTDKSSTETSVTGDTTGDATASSIAVSGSGSGGGTSSTATTMTIAAAKAVASGPLTTLVTPPTSLSSVSPTVSLSVTNASTTISTGSKSQGAISNSNVVAFA